jgi:hypothetical protein
MKVFSLTPFPKNNHIFKIILKNTKIILNKEAKLKKIFQIEIERQRLKLSVVMC